MCDLTFLFEPVYAIVVIVLCVLHCVFQSNVFFGSYFLRVAKCCMSTHSCFAQLYFFTKHVAYRFFGSFVFVVVTHFGMGSDLLFCVDHACAWGFAHCHCVLVLSVRRCGIRILTLVGFMVAC